MGSIACCSRESEEDERGLSEELLSPSLERLERGDVCQVEGEHAAVGTPIEGDTQRVELLHPGRVPDLNDFRSIKYVDGLGDEVSGRSMNVLRECSANGSVVLRLT